MDAVRSSQRLSFSACLPACHGSSCSHTFTFTVATADLRRLVAALAKPSIHCLDHFDLLSSNMAWGQLEVLMFVTYSVQLKKVQLHSMQSMEHQEQLPAHVKSS